MAGGGHLRSTLQQQQHPARPAAIYKAIADRQAGDASNSAAAFEPSQERLAPRRPRKAPGPAHPFPGPTQGGGLQPAVSRSRLSARDARGRCASGPGRDLGLRARARGRLERSREAAASEGAFSSLSPTRAARAGRRRLLLPSHSRRSRPRPGERRGCLLRKDAPARSPRAPPPPRLGASRGGARLPGEGPGRRHSPPPV